jgi:hypothetical protein
LVRPAAAVRFGKVRNEKARGRFPGAGSILNFRDDEDMPVICPTGQVLFLKVA